MTPRYAIASVGTATALTLGLAPTALAADTPPPAAAQENTLGQGDTAEPSETPEQGPQVQDVALTIMCEAVPKTSLVGAQVIGPEKVSFQLTAPREVTTGEEFSLDLNLDPVEMDIDLPMGATIDSASRLKLDFALPAGVNFVGAAIDESEANITGLAAFTVNEQGYKDPTGRILRFSSADNQTIGNGPNTAQNREGGITHKVKNNKLDLRFPKVSVKFRATTEGEKSFGVRTAGAAGKLGDEANFLTLLGKANAPIVGTVWAPVRCAPLLGKDGPVDESAASLLTVNALPGDPEDQLKYSSVEVRIDGPTTGTVKQRGEYRVELTPDEGVAADVNGALTFTDNGRTVLDGDDALQVPVVRGVAEADFSWLQPGVHTLEARFHPYREDLATVFGTGSIDVDVEGAAGQEQDKDAAGSAGSSSGGFFDLLQKILGFLADFFRSIFKF